MGRGQKSESVDRYRALQACCEIEQDLQKAEELHERITTRRMGTEMATSSIAIGADIRRVEGVCVPRVEWLWAVLREE